MFPIEIDHIGSGFVQGVGKLITKRSGSWLVGSPTVQLSIYRWGSLFSREKAKVAVGGKVELKLSSGLGEVAIVEDNVA